MKYFLSLLFLHFFLTNSQVVAQSEAALPLIYYTPSLISNGSGLSGTSIQSDDAFGFYYNPANLGFFGRDKNLSFQFYSSSPELEANSNTADYNSFALNIGYNLKKHLGLNLSAGAGFIQNSFNYKKVFDLTIKDEDSYNAYGFGVMLDYYISVSLGLTFKSIHSELGFASADANPIDYGILIEVPFMKLINNDLTIPLSTTSKLKPIVNYSIGYSRLNVGDEIFYVDPAQSDPLPLTARLGHSFKFGFDLQTSCINLNILNYDLILEADDILIERTSSGINYQGMFGDIEIGKHLIQLKGDDKVVVHKGHTIKIAETITFLIGSFTERYILQDNKSDGFIISSRGLIKLLNSLIDNSLLNYISNHVEIKYINSVVFAGTLLETDFAGLSVSLFNYSFN